MVVLAIGVNCYTVSKGLVLRPSNGVFSAHAIFFLYMKIAIVGSRTFNDYGVMIDFIEKIVQEETIAIDEIISGGAKGADSLAERLAHDYDIKLTVFPADWEKYGKRAGAIRNQEIIKNCDICFAFWDGISRGTKISIDLCTLYNKPCYIYSF